MGLGPGRLGGPGHAVFGLSGSADDPLTFEDRNSFQLKQGTRKTLLSNVRKLQTLWLCEQEVLQSIVNRSRKLRGCKADLIEVYAGAAHISEVALKKGLRVIEPIDQVYGITLPRKGKQSLVDLIEKRRPFLTIYEVECRLWSPLANLNYYYRPEVLEELRRGERDGVRSMTRHCEQIHAEGRIFLIENPGPSALWGESRGHHYGYVLLQSSWTTQWTY